METVGCGGSNFLPSYMKVQNSLPVTWSSQVILSVEIHDCDFWFRYDKAVWWFEKTLALIPASLSETWEPTVVNLAHAYRKLK